MISLYEIGHGSLRGTLSFKVETTANNVLRTQEDVKNCVEIVRKAIIKYPSIHIIYVSNFEHLSTGRLENMNTLMWALKNLKLTVVGVYSCAALQSWIAIANYTVVSGVYEDYQSYVPINVNEHLVDDSPENGVLVLEGDVRNIYYNQDKVKSMLKAIDELNKVYKHNNGFYTEKSFKVEIK